MATPKKQMSRTRSGNRRSHLALTRPATATCSHCQAINKPHTVCDQCGYYRGKKLK